MRIVFLSLLAGAALVGCGGDDADDPIGPLAAYLPADTPGGVLFADLAAAREQLGLPADADALAFELYGSPAYDPGAPETQLLELGGFATSILGLSARDLKPQPVTEAFDGGAVTAAAAAGTRAGPVTAIRTSQPFDEIATALEAVGYERDGAVLSKPGAEVNEVVDAGDGVLVISGRDASAADAVADPPGGPGAALALLEPADEPVRLAASGFENDCVSGYGGWSNAAGTSGVLRVGVDGEPDLDRVQLDGFDWIDGELGEPSVVDDGINVPFTDAEGDNGTVPLRDFEAGSLGTGLYDCG